ncbi:hypothetical protein K7X08_021261 [Anisodus acutangulus]|uniref:Uncharacterized protein n=1 Tax=Anisodus acutangulus TaxID=402998 RepID=A0A9Q1M0V6_9SOLA|nr:hypothetical protein K7X08_021261 [Anisodus acutangulus]
MGINKFIISSHFKDNKERGYYVLNDIFQFVGVEESSAVVEEKVDDNISVASLELATLSKAEDVDFKEVSENQRLRLQLMTKLGTSLRPFRTKK